MNERDMTIHLIVGLMKKILHKKVNTFLNHLEVLEKNINIKVDLSIYATKTDLKNVTHVNTSSFAVKTNLANLKTKVDKLDIGNSCWLE